jgi:membrane-bound serine protease (ClpP class)
MERRRGVGLAILFFFLGLILLVVELFFPSFGILSLSAAGSFVAAVIFAFGESQAAGFVFLGSTLVAIPAALWFGFRTLPKTRVGQRIVLRAPPSRMDTSRSDRATSEPLIGREGVATSELRPSGTIELDGSRLDAVTRGEYIEQGRRVRVLLHEGNRLVVEEIPGSDAETPDRKKPRWA